MGITEIITGHSQEKMHWGDGLGLYDIGRNKIIGLATLAIFYQQANDKELKNLIKYGVEKLVIPHIEKIQKTLKEEGLEYPNEPAIKEKLNLDVPNLKPNTLIGDDEISISLRELTRLTLTLETEALRNATRKDVRELLINIFEDDDDAYTEIIKLQKAKNWSDMPPYLIH
jgi:hypothetical protein